MNEEKGKRPEHREPEKYSPEEHRRETHEPDRPEHESWERPRRRRGGREHKVHQEILARRMEGGAPPTPDAHAEALRQWQQLPGSLVRPPTDVGAKKESPPAGETSPAPPGQDIDKDKDKGRQS